VTNGVADHAGNDPVTGAEASATHLETSGGAGVPAGHETTLNITCMSAHRYEMWAGIMAESDAIFESCSIFLPLGCRPLTIGLVT
jgi:hypothetical protein